VTDTAVARDFEALLDFRLDPFQHEAIAALAAGRSVLVAAPTGAGKTVVGEFACHDALAEGGRTFYTTPIKALSNQKFRDLGARYGVEQVGLLTGDRSVNPRAPVVVMTTEVLRNMIYERSDALDGLRHVVLDEVHYLADRERGAVWEEVIIHLPLTVQLAALSATVSNAEAFGRWLDQVRHGCEVIVSEVRPVPLRHHYFVNGRIYDTFRAGRKQGASREHRDRAAEARAGVPNPDVLMLERRAGQRNRVSARGRRQAPEVRLRWPSRPEVVEELAQRRWLPVIVFVFSRAGCDGAVEQLVRAGTRLTTESERHEIAAVVDLLFADVPPDDLEVLGFQAWRAGLLDGLAAHHAGMVPAFKECVEQLFQRGLLKVVVATETLALGINMPARTVVLERLEKWDGERHVRLTPGEYTQLTGRAGRRGIDDVGHAVVLHQRDVSFREVAGLVGTRSFPLRSSFTPSYNMAVNLLRHHDLADAEALLGASFAQFEADASVSRRADRLREVEAGIEGYAVHLRCEAGDWTHYWRLRHELTAQERVQERDRRASGERVLRSALAALAPGDVLALDQSAAVVGVHLSKAGNPVAQIVTADGALTRVGMRELSAPPRVVDRVRLPAHGNPRQRDYRRAVADLLRRIDRVVPAPVDDTHTRPDPAQQARIDALRAELGAHPCHRCPDRSEHERWQHRTDALVDEADELRAQIGRATGSLVRRFARIRRVLEALGYLDDRPAPTSQGLVLARIYSDVDLLVAEAVRTGVFAPLDAAELAGIAALLVHESRGDDAPMLRPPTARLAEATDALETLAVEIRTLELDTGLAPLRPLDPGFMRAAWRWAQGADLDDALEHLELTGGDFVRIVKQTADLLGQLRDVAGPTLRPRIADAITALRRGIVEA
jgi:ATP-dependent RNA helicase HelY